MLQILQQGGVILWIIIALSPIATVIIIERLLYFRKIRVDEEKLIQRLKSSLEKGHYDEAGALDLVKKFVFEYQKGLVHRFPPAISRKISLRDGVVISKRLMIAPRSRSLSRTACGVVSCARTSST